MNSAEITAAVTAAANVIAAQLTNTQVNQLGAVFTLLGEVLQTIAVIRPNNWTPPLQGGNAVAPGEPPSSQGQNITSQGNEQTTAEGSAAAQSGSATPPAAVT